MEEGGGDATLAVAWYVVCDVDRAAWLPSDVILLYGGNIRWTVRSATVTRLGFISQNKHRRCFTYDLNTVFHLTDRPES